MFGGYKCVFFLIISMLYSSTCSADFFDIPLFSDSSKASSEKQTASTGATSKNDKSASEEPNLGRKSIPLEKLVLTPNPLPPVEIPLVDKEPEPVVVPEPVVLANTRETGINIPPSEGADPVSPQPLNLANVHDVRQFDVAGFYLGMTLKEVLQMAQKKGYTLVKTKKTLPLFRTSRYEILCRRQGIYVPEQVRACIRAYGEKNKQVYIQEILFAKKATRESFLFRLTSPATGNEVYQIIYSNKGDNSLNFTPVNLAKKLGRKEAFFHALFEMYGYPDDNKALIWGAKEKAYMQVSMSGSAYDATINLVDTQLSNEDYFAATDWQADQPVLYHFDFAE